MHGGAGAGDGAGCGADVLAQCFADDVRVSKLASGSVVARGAAKVAAALAAAPRGNAKAAKTVCIECAEGGFEDVLNVPTMVLAFFGAGEAPGFTPRGIAKPAASTTAAGPPPQGLALLMRAEAGKLDHIWFGSAETTVRDADVLEIVRESLVPLQGAEY
eukprot:SAG22_NODE_8499_length_651_cov_0.864130_1_plen_160_part_01